MHHKKTPVAWFDGETLDLLEALGADPRLDVRPGLSAHSGSSVAVHVLVLDGSGWRPAPTLDRDLVSDAPWVLLTTHFDGSTDWMVESLWELGVEDIVDLEAARQRPDLLADKILSAHRRFAARQRTAGTAGDQFLAVISHELRTPLNHVIGIIESMHEGVAGDLRPEQARFLEMARESAGHLLGIINDLLMLSRIDAGAMHLDIRPIDVAELVGTAERMISHAAFNKGLSISISVSPNAERVYGDERALTQVLSNLLSNAVRFTPAQGGIGVTTSLDGEGSRFLLEVWDTGIGIDHHELPNIFEPFVQIDSGVSRSHEGTGLGLALVKKLVELHGGTIQARSAGRHRGGSRFIISLPWDSSKTKVTLAKPDALGENTTVQGLVLITDDDPIARKIVGAYLQAKGFAITEAEDANRALELVGLVKPDAVIMDLALPGKSGLEAIRDMRADPRLQSVPILALTAHALQGDEQRCLDAGADLYFSKPARYGELVAALRQLMRERHSRKDRPTPSDEPRDP